MKVLMVLTSHDQRGDTGRKTGFWLEELAAPYYIFKESGAEITLASPKGGIPRSIPRVMSPNSGPNFRAGSRRTPLRKPSLTKLFALTASSRKVSTPSSIPVVTVRCGISPKTRTRSS